MAKKYFAVKKNVENATGGSFGVLDYIYEESGIHMKNGWYDSVTCEVFPTKETRLMENGHKAKIFKGAEGQEWGMYRDGSAALLKTELTEQPKIRQDLDGNDITMEIFLEAKKDMIADGILNENDTYSYDDYCNQCQDL